jgi:hypothetical protein
VVVRLLDKVALASAQIHTGVTCARLVEDGPWVQGFAARDGSIRQLLAGVTAGA